MIYSVEVWGNALSIHIQEFTAVLQSESGRKNCFRIARQMAREGRDVISVCCIKNDAGNVVSDADGMKNIWRMYMEKLLNVENDCRVCV